MVFCPVLLKHLLPLNHPVAAKFSALAVASSVGAHFWSCRSDRAGHVESAFLYQLET